MSEFDFSDFLDALDGESFEERPVSVEEFVTSKDFLGLPPLSEYQYQMINASTLIIIVSLQKSKLRL